MEATRPNDTEPADSSDPFEGTAYRALRLLGQGGMGEVFEVEHRALGRRFAAKVLRASRRAGPELADRLRLEAQALGRLGHPNIVSVCGFATTADGRPFVVMELLHGHTLARELELRGSLPVAFAAHCAMDLLAALEATHALGIVHRDVKPSNIFLATGAGGSTTLKLLDFGIARVLPDAPPSAPSPLAEPTRTGRVLGTPRYTSPEAATGGHVDARADLYGVGLVLYVMLAGRGPFDEAAGASALRDAHAHETPAPPSHFAREPVPAELDALVLRALAKDPAARFDDARELRQELSRVAELFERPVGWLATTAFERETSSRSDGRSATLDATVATGLSATTTGATGAPTWLLFVAGVVVAALAVAALAGALGGAP